MTRRGGTRVLFFAAALALAAAVTQVSAAASAAPTVASPAVTAVGVITDTFVDSHRTTEAWGPTPEQTSRTLVTTILYPSATGSSSSPVPDAPPARTGAPYPLIVFAHGLGSSPKDYMTLLVGWASAGFVVAAPLFPLSSSETPGGPDAGDVQNQPGDMSFVIDSVLNAAAEPSGTLSGLVDPHEIGAAGHSNGAITTLGLVANSCCRDQRVRAAVVMAGTTEGFTGGHYLLSKAPPLLLVHGTADQIVPYASAVTIFNSARGPKGLVTIRGGGHQSAAGVVPPSSTAVIDITTAFFDAYLRNDSSALHRIVGHPNAHVTVHFVPRVGASATLPVPAAPVVHLKASVSPSTGLRNGQTVVVHWSGYTPGKVVNILECSHVDFQTADSSGCDFSNALVLHADPKGHGSASVTVATGKIGNGICDASHNHCFFLVNNSSSTAPSETRRLPVSFGP